MVLSGCEKSDIVIAYNASDYNGIVKTYYEMPDGTWKCNNITYQYRLELKGRMPNAESDSCYVVLTDNNNLTFKEVSKSMYSSLLEDSKVMEGSVIVEMR